MDKSVDDLVSRLERMERDATKAARSVISDAADDLVSEAKRLAPVDEGDLRQSIRVGVATAGRDGMETDVIADAPHALAAEYGTQHRMATPYLRPAINQVKESMAAAFETRVGGVLRSS